MKNGSSVVGYLRVRLFVLAMVCLGAASEVRATWYVRCHNSGGTTLVFYITKNGSPVSNFGVAAGATDLKSLGGTLFNGDVVTVFTGSYTGTQVYRDDGFGANYTQSGGGTEGQIVPPGGAAWDSGEAAPPTLWCWKGEVINLMPAEIQYVVGFNHPTTGVYTEIAQFVLFSGGSRFVEVSGLPTTVHIGISELPVSGVEYLGEGMYKDAADMNTPLYSSFAGPSDAGWFVCGGSASGTNKFKHGLDPLKFDLESTNIPIDFAKTNLTIPSTNLLTEKSGQIGFQSLAAIGLAQTRQIAQSAADTADKLGDMREAIRGLTNGLGNGALISALTNGLQAQSAALTNQAKGIGDTNAGFLASIRDNTSNTVRNVDRMREIMEGGGLSNEAVNAHISGAYTLGYGTNTISQAGYLDAEVGQAALSDALSDAGSYSFTAPEDSFFKVNLNIPGHPDWEMNFNPRSNSAIADLMDWIRTALVVILNLGFMMYAYRRAQKYLWDLLVASNQKPIDGGAITWLANRSIGYVLVMASMAVIASVPGYFVTYFESSGGWGSAVSNIGHLSGTSNTMVSGALGIANWIIPVPLAITQFISAALYEVSISQVAILAMGVLRFIKVFAFVALLGWSSAYAEQVEILVVNYSGGPVTNSLDTNFIVFPEGRHSFYMESEIEYLWSWGGGAAAHEPHDRVELTFTGTQMLESSAKSPWEWFWLGFGVHTGIWVTGWMLKVYRSYGRDLIAAAD